MAVAVTTAAPAAVAENKKDQVVDPYKNMVEDGAGSEEEGSGKTESIGLSDKADSWSGNEQEGSEEEEYDEEEEEEEEESDEADHGESTATQQDLADLKR